MADSENFPHEPEVIGSESRIYRQKDVDAAEKRGRAEVLAACIRGVEVYFDDFYDVPPAPISLEQVIKALRGVQPAASDLEELLRKERLEEARLRPHQDGCATLLSYAKADDCDGWCGRNKRIVELEKARAEGKG